MMLLEPFYGTCFAQNRRAKINHKEGIMKNISIRIAAIIFGIALAWVIVSCSGQIQLGEVPQETGQMSPQEQLQLLIDEGKVPEGMDRVEEKAEEPVDDFPNVNRKPPSLAPVSNEFVMIYGFMPNQDPHNSPNIVASADLESNMYKDNAADLISAFLKKIEERYGISVKDSKVAAFYKRAGDNYPASRLIAIKGGDLSRLKEKMEKGEMESQNNQNIVIYKGPHFYMAETDGINLIGSKDYVAYAMGDEGYSIVAAYLEADDSPFKLISDSSKLVERVFGFLKPAFAEANKPVKNITSVNAKYFAVKKEVELTANYYADQINQATAVYKFDSGKFDWERFIKMLGEFIGVEEKVELMKDEAANVSPVEQDSLKYDQNKIEEMNMPANVKPGEANY